MHNEGRPTHTRCAHLNLEIKRDKGGKEEHQKGLTSNKKEVEDEKDRVTCGELVTGEKATAAP